MGKNQLLTGLLLFVGDQESPTPFLKALMQGLSPWTPSFPCTVYQFCNSKEVLIPSAEGGTKWDGCSLQSCFSECPCALLGCRRGA